MSKPITLISSDVVLGAGLRIQSASGNAVNCRGLEEIRGVISSDLAGTLLIRQAARGDDGPGAAGITGYLESTLAYVPPNMVAVLFAGVPLRIDGPWIFVQFTNDGAVAQARFRIDIWAVQR